MKILYAAAEISPFARISHTADLLRFLPASLQDKGFEIRILLPKYGSINDRRNRLHEVIRLAGIKVQVGENEETMKIKVASIPNGKLQVYFLDNDTYYKRKGLFTDPKDEQPFADNDERLVLYNKGILETVIRLGWKPDIIHCHDWPAGLVPLLVRTVYRDNPLFEGTKIIYNLHHPENQGVFQSDRILDLAGIPADVDRSELLHDGAVDLVRLGVRYSDHVVTGNYLKDQFDPLFDEFSIQPTKIQGAPEDVSNAFATYYRSIAGQSS